MDQMKELLQFLRDRNPQVRQIALSNLLSQTPKTAPYRNIFFSGQTGGLQKKENDVIRDLKLLCRDQLSVAHDAFKALVNLSDSPMLVSTLSETSFLAFIVSYIINPQAILADLASMLLSNLTASTAACAKLLSLTVNVVPDPKFPNGFYPTQSRCATCVAPEPYPLGESQETLALPLLLDAFVEGSQVVSSGDLSKRTRKAHLHFLASVFANITTSPIGRNFFFTPQASNFLNPDSPVEYPLIKLVAFTEHSDTIRRGGVTSTLKNCAFHPQGHPAMLTDESTKVSVPPSGIEAPGMGVLPYILLPLAGPEEFDLDDQEKLPDALQFLPPTKAREQDSALRLMHVETLLLLCHTRWGRDFLREHGVYEIIRATHMVEKEDKISEHIERLVNLLHGDEPSYDIDTDLDVAAAANAATVTTSVDASAVKQQDPESDDEDSRIEEV